MSRCFPPTFQHRPSSITASNEQPRRNHPLRSSLSTSLQSGEARRAGVAVESGEIGAGQEVVEIDRRGASVGDQNAILAREHLDADAEVGVGGCAGEGADGGANGSRDRGARRHVGAGERGILRDKDEVECPAGLCQVTVLLKVGGKGEPYLHWVAVQESEKGLMFALVARASMGEAAATLEKRAPAPAIMAENFMLTVLWLVF